MRYVIKPYLKHIFSLLPSSIGSGLCCQVLLAGRSPWKPPSPHTRAAQDVRLPVTGLTGFNPLLTLPSLLDPICTAETPVRSQHPFWKKEPGAVLPHLSGRKLLEAVQRGIGPARPPDEFTGLLSVCSGTEEAVWQPAVFSCRPQLLQPQSHELFKITLLKQIPLQTNHGDLLDTERTALFPSRFEMKAPTSGVKVLKVKGTVIACPQLFTRQADGT
ncbi:hypothetical protein SKAU_G00337940 [Synaphobranchus kaupii]|uniref:Uncharacterized protein n=1 Tax=Synaphobranchus kaupii TaxID=118154 RepID=A0A9Q1IGY5_SYNKA|nr:hypothetical protein SKAU_G00337940 [Synaphobranchus kaupii]